MEDEDRFPITKLDSDVTRHILKWLDYERLVKENNAMKKTITAALCKCGVRKSRFIGCNMCGEIVCEKCEALERNCGSHMEYYCSEKCSKKRNDIAVYGSICQRKNQYNARG